MLPPWIIEKIKKREEEERRKRDDRPQPQLPVPEPLPPPPPPKEPNPDQGDRGVVIIDPSKDGDESRVGEVISFF